MPRLTPLLFLYAVTMAHHLYGGFVLDSTERIVISGVFTVVMALTVLMHRLGFRAVFVALTVLWVTVVGLVEGGYNHALYLVLRLFRINLHGAEQSNDIFFQATGVLTLLAVIPIIFWRQSRSKAS